MSKLKFKNNKTWLLARFCYFVGEPGIVLTVTKLVCFLIVTNLASAAGHGSLVRKLTSLRRSIPDEREAVHVLSLTHKKTA